MGAFTIAAVMASGLGIAIDTLFPINMSHINTIPAHMSLKDKVLKIMLIITWAIDY